MCETKVFAKEAFSRLLAGEQVELMYDLSSGAYRLNGDSLERFQEIYPNEGYWNPTGNIYLIESEEK